MLGAAAVLAFFALVALNLAWSRHLAGHRLASTGHLALAAICAAAAAVLWSLAVEFEEYRTLDESEPVAELFFERTAPGRFRVTLTRLPEGRMQVFAMTGHQWRIDVRTLAWKNEALRLGLSPRYRLERLSARDTSREIGPGDSVSGYALAEDPDRDVWNGAREWALWTRQAQAVVAYGPWRPMTSGARFEVRLRPGDVAVKPVNETPAGARPRS